jgi:hypothetical protein
MSKNLERKVVGSLAARLPQNISLLARQIARKPANYTRDWAATVDESFFLYTRTSTVNLLLSINETLMAMNWPFPAYVDLRKEVTPQRLSAFGKPLQLLLRTLAGDPPVLAGVAMAGWGEGPDHQKLLSSFMTFVFRKNRNKVFDYWRKKRLLKAHKPMLADIEFTYCKHRWAACTPTVLALLDFVIRTYFDTDNLYVSVQTLRRAFEQGGIASKDLKPGFSVWKGNSDPNAGNALAKSLEEDLRLPGILLSSFVEFACKYYAPFTSAPATGVPVLNRHAIMHCALDYWTEDNVVKILTFFDLTLRLEPALRILIHGSSAQTGLNERES